MSHLSIVPTEETIEQPWKLVVHRRPDTDALACLWAADRFIVPEGTSRQIVFHDAGEKLSPADEAGHTVLYMDTGGSSTDQHGRGLVRGSSFQLLAEEYGLVEDPGIAPILELTRATDNVERISLTDVHYILKGLPVHLRDQGSNEIDWNGVCDCAFLLLDILHGQALQRASSVEEFASKGQVFDLPNGRSIACVWSNPQLREAAFDAGHDVVMWTISKGKNGAWVGIQVNRDSDVQLHQVVADIRTDECFARKLAMPSRKMLFASSSTQSGVPGWFMHESGKLVTCGTRSHPIGKDEFTRLSPERILGCIKGQLARMTPRT